jgi:hypothetical protein
MVRRFVSSRACVSTFGLGSHKQAPRIPMNQILDFIVNYPTVTATLTLAGGLAVERCAAFERRSVLACLTFRRSREVRQQAPGDVCQKERLPEHASVGDPDLG